MLVQGPQGLWEPQVKGILDDFYPHHGNTSIFQVNSGCKVSRRVNVRTWSSRTGHTEYHVQVTRHSYVLIFSPSDIKVHIQLCLRVTGDARVVKEVRKLQVND
jgi:hypothetical protein